MAKNAKITVELDEKDIDIVDIISDYLAVDWSNFDDPRKISKRWYRFVDKVWAAKRKNDA
jgi:hypothetical protein